MHINQTNWSTLRIKQLACLTAPIILAACAVTSQNIEPATSNGNDCFFSSSLRDWRPLDNENLLLFVSGRRAYHIQLVRPAVALSQDITIGIYDRDGLICPYGGDAIIVDGFMPERISIRSIRRLNEAQLDQVYIEYGIRPPAIVNSEAIALEGEE